MLTIFFSYGWSVPLIFCRLGRFENHGDEMIVQTNEWLNYYIIRFIGKKQSVGRPQLDHNSFRLDQGIF